jgi:hypothetical protein
LLQVTDAGRIFVRLAGRVSEGEVGFGSEAVGMPATSIRQQAIRWVGPSCHHLFLHLRHMRKADMPHSRRCCCCTVMYATRCSRHTWADTIRTSATRGAPHACACHHHRHHPLARLDVPACTSCLCVTRAMIHMCDGTGSITRPPLLNIPLNQGHKCLSLCGLVHFSKQMP